jgi:hypothetical protein
MILNTTELQDAFKIQPDDITISREHWCNSFNNYETEISAKRLVEFARSRGLGWAGFKQVDVDRYEQEKFDDPGLWYHFNKLCEDRKNDPIQRDGDTFWFTSDFILTCYRASLR